ncbi:Murein L,D-transpeptidase YafK [Thiohalospira halophila DSM 15071]|uniref:Murein L,D-transpeptidase YafK n=1 Tax=Thiohalospira halophila DSM 15071 TaxID=1123397 RepID=A0A1I1TP31_9GAMM|nr:L,D-transpeptidase family protein [Thiohalospira halophila]SFD60175.1 Murein L,D-transpeptidase YafK [Thiohalospira halophila DSM 15071]
MTRFLAGSLGGLVLVIGLLAPAVAEQLAFNRAADYPGSGFSPRVIAEEADGDLLQRARERLGQRVRRHPGDTEARLLLGLIHFREGDYAAALESLDEVVRRAPDFQLAHLVRGDLLLSRSRVVAGLGGNGVAAAVEGEGDLSRNALRAEARARLEGYLETLRTARVPAALLQLSPENPVALLVDKRHNRLYVYERRGDGRPPRRIRDHYVSTGQARGDKEREGDLRTPEGVYFVQEFLEDGELPAEYGLGAFTLDYPNPLDRRRGKTGYGIWLHGTDRRFFSRPPLDSEGCVVLPNLNLQDLRGSVSAGTPVIIAERLDWIDHEQWRQRRRAARQAVEGWRRSWEAMAVERYLAYYDADFWSPRGERARWTDYKRRVLATKTDQAIRLERRALLAYPDSAAGRAGNLVVARFRQDYDSNNYRGVMDKQLYLRREAGDWSVLYEGPAP